MRAIRYLLSAFAFTLFATIAHAQAQGNDGDFGLINPPQTTIPGKKVEVIEFFAYYCPHCNALDPSLAEWVKRQGDNIVFTRVHTSPNGEPFSQQRLFYALEAMGLEEQYHSKILKAIHVEREHLTSDVDIANFISTLGIDKIKFQSVYNSFSVQSKVQHALQMQRAYGVTNWPTIVFDGRLFTSPPMAGAKLSPYNEVVAQGLMLKAMDQMVVKLRQERDK